MVQDNEAPPWKQFEFHCWYLLLGWFPEEGGWEIEYQEESGAGRPDFVVRQYDANGNIRQLIVVDAKDRERVSGSDVDQVVGYAEEFGADQILLMVAWDTRHSAEIGDEIDDENIEVRVTEWRHPGSRCYCYDPEDETFHPLDG